MKYLKSSILHTILVLVAILLSSDIFTTKVQCAVTTYRVYREIRDPRELSEQSDQSENESEPYLDPWLPISKEITLNEDGSTNMTLTHVVRPRRRRVKGRRRYHTATPRSMSTSTSMSMSVVVNRVSNNGSTAEVTFSNSTDSNESLSDSSFSSPTILTIEPELQNSTPNIEDLHVIFNDSLVEQNISLPEEMDNNTQSDSSDTTSTSESQKMAILHSTFLDLFSPLSLALNQTQNEDRGTNVSDTDMYDHLMQFQDNDTDLHISESSNPYVNSSTPISTELQKSLEFQYLHPILNTDNVITDAEQKIPDNKTVHIENKLANTLAETPISHEVRTSPGHIKKKHPLLNQDSIISSRVPVSKNGPTVDVQYVLPTTTKPIEETTKTASGVWKPTTIINSVRIDEFLQPQNDIKSALENPRESDIKEDNDFSKGGKGFTVILPKDFTRLENGEPSTTLRTFGMEYPSEKNRQLDVPEQTIEQQKQLSEYELLQELLKIEKTLSEINGSPSERTPAASSEAEQQPFLTSQMNENELKNLLQLSFLDSVLNPSTTTTTTTTTTTKAPIVVSQKSRDKGSVGLSDSDLRSIYYMLERMVVNASSTTAPPPTTTTTTKKKSLLPVFPSLDNLFNFTPLSTSTEVPSLENFFNLLQPSDPLNQGKRNVISSPSPVYKHLNVININSDGQQQQSNASPGARNLDGTAKIATSATTVTAPALPLNNKAAADNSLDLLTQLINLSLAAESANLANKQTPRATQAPQQSSLDLLSLLSNGNLGALGSAGALGALNTAPVTAAPPTQQQSQSELLNIFGNQTPPKPNGLYYWLDLNAFLGGDPTADPSAGIRPKLGQKDHFVKVKR